MIMSRLKNHLKWWLNVLHLDLTKNLQYDRLTMKIMKKVIGPGSNCVDVGCHKGEILRLMIRQAPRGKHYAFEPIPLYYEQLKRQFAARVQVLPYALSDRNGSSEFCFVRNAPAYSGLKRRRYDNIVPDIEKIRVSLKRLDDIVPETLQVDFIKIDVEGGEYDVMKGALELLKRSHPVVIFECGKSSGLHYGTRPEEMYQFLTLQAGLKVSRLASFLKNESSLKAGEFVDYYHSEEEYYFVAHP